MINAAGATPMLYDEYDEYGGGGFMPPRQKNDPLPARIGRLYELACKAGVVRAFDDAVEDIRNYDHVMHRFRQDRSMLVDALNQYRLDEIIPQIVDQTHPTPDTFLLVQHYLEPLLKQGMLNLYSVVREYIRHVNGQQRGGIQDLLFLYCPISGFGKVDEEQYDQLAYQRVGELIGQEFDPRPWRKTGEFLKSDLLAIFNTYDGPNLLVVEMSCSAPRTLAAMMDATSPADLVHSFTKDMRHNQQKSIFSGANVESGDLHFTLSEGLREHFVAMVSSDKEPTKAVQGSSNADSCLDMLDQYGSPSLAADWRERWQANIVVATNRGIETINAEPRSRAVLAAARKVYPALREGRQPDDLLAHRRKLARKSVEYANESFDDPRSHFTLEQVTAATTGSPRILTEEISGIHNPNDPVTDEQIRRWLGDQHHLVQSPKHLRDAHSQLVRHALEAPELEVLLMAFPGAGKTFTVKEFLREIKGGTMFYYLSPRVILNEKLMNSFAKMAAAMKAAVINTNSVVIDTANRRLKEQPARSVILRGVDAERLRSLPRNDQIAFLEAEEAEPGVVGRTVKERRKWRQAVMMASETIVAPNDSRQAGVFNSLTYATRTLLDNGFDTVIAAGTIQALRSNGRGGHTTDAFVQNIFKGGLRNRKPTLEALEALARKCPTIIFFVDEITADPAGAKLYSELLSLLGETFHRPFREAGKPMPFKLKLIIADASLTDQKTVEAYLSDSKPSSDRIYIEPVSPEVANRTLTYRRIPSQRLTGGDRIFINANGFPATQPLKIRYHLALNRLSTEATARTEYTALDSVSEYERRLLHLALERKEEQTILMLQDKKRISKIEKALLESCSPDAVLTIHSQLTRPQRGMIENGDPEAEPPQPPLKDTTRLVLMTSSGARGIDFPRTHRVICDVPAFSIEQNLMEIVQAIYRPRGEDGDGLNRDQEPRVIDIVLCRNVYISPEAGLDENLLQDELESQAVAVINLLLLVRAAIHTRLIGSGRIGKHTVAVTPVGGKSVDSAGQSLSRDIGDICQKLRSFVQMSNRSRELQGHLTNLETALQSLFHDSEYRFTDRHADDGNGILCERMKREFGRTFNATLKLGFGGLVEMQPFPRRAFVLGQMLVEHIEGGVTERFKFQTWDSRVMAQVESMRRSLAGIDRGIVPHDLGKDLNRVESLLWKLRGSMHETEYQDQFDHGGHSLRYIAVPILAYDRAKELNEYVPNTDLNEEHLRDILRGYLRYYTRIEDVIPRISTNAYASAAHPFPYLAFTNPYLSKIGLKWFSKNHLAATPDFNIINLLTMAGDEPVSE
jgi:hypothetical protein